jgi:hypothetical protein
MIYPYDNSTQTRWDRGEFKVQLTLPNNPRLAVCADLPHKGVRNCGMPNITKVFVGQVSHGG